LCCKRKRTVISFISSTNSATAPVLAFVPWTRLGHPSKSPVGTLVSWSSLMSLQQFLNNHYSCAAIEGTSDVFAPLAAHSPMPTCPVAELRSRTHMSSLIDDSIYLILYKWHASCKKWSSVKLPDKPLLLHQSNTV
jgi:hypothetical protein